MFQLPPRLRNIAEHAGTVEANKQQYNVLRFNSAPPGPKPTEHLSVLRNPYHRLNHCDAYLSPELHNISPTYVRLLENEAKSLAEADYAWAKFLNYNASAFTLGDARRRDQKRQEKAIAMHKAQAMKIAVERGDSYKYTPDYDAYDDSSSDSDDDDYDDDDEDGDAYDHLYAVDDRSSGTNTPSSSVERSPVMKLGTGFYNMSEYTTSSLALPVDDGLEDSYANSTNDQVHNTPAHTDNLRGVVGSSGNFTHSSDIASGSTFAQTKMPLIYPDLPMPPPHAILGLETPRFAGVHDESGDLALQTPQFAIDLNESLDRALHNYENTTLSPIEGDSPVSLEPSSSELRNRTYTIVEKEPGEHGKVSKITFIMCPSPHEAVTQSPLQEGNSKENSSSARDDSSPRRRRYRAKKEYKHAKKRVDMSPGNVEGAQARMDEGIKEKKLTTHHAVLNTDPGSPSLGRLLDPLLRSHVTHQTSSTFYSHANTQFVHKPRRKHRYRNRTYELLHGAL